MRQARNLLIEGKITRAEYNKILKADKHNQEKAEMKAKKTRKSSRKTDSKKPGRRELVVNVLGKERAVKVQQGATWGWVLSEIMRKEHSRIGASLLIGMRNKDSKYMDLGEEVPETFLGQGRAVANKVFAVAVQNTKDLVCFDFMLSLFITSLFGCLLGKKAVRRLW